MFEQKGLQDPRFPELQKEEDENRPNSFQVIIWIINRLEPARLFTPTSGKLLIPPSNPTIVSKFSGAWRLFSWTNDEQTTYLAGIMLICNLIEP
jgi:hypothetical protein